LDSLAETIDNKKDIDSTISEASDQIQDEKRIEKAREGNLKKVTDLEKNIATLTEEVKSLQKQQQEHGKEEEATFHEQDELDNIYIDTYKKMIETSAVVSAIAHVKSQIKDLPVSNMDKNTNTIQKAKITEIENELTSQQSNLQKLTDKLANLNEIRKFEKELRGKKILQRELKHQIDKESKLHSVQETKKEDLERLQALLNVNVKKFATKKETCLKYLMNEQSETQAEQTTLDILQQLSQSSEKVSLTAESQDLEARIKYVSALEATDEKKNSEIHKRVQDTEAKAKFLEEQQKFDSNQLTEAVAFIEKHRSIIDQKKAEYNQAVEEVATLRANALAADYLKRYTAQDKLIKELDDEEMKATEERTAAEISLKELETKKLDCSKKLDDVSGGILKTNETLVQKTIELTTAEKDKEIALVKANEVVKTQLNILQIEKTLVEQKKAVLFKKKERYNKIEKGITNPIAILRLGFKEVPKPKPAVEDY